MKEDHEARDSARRRRSHAWSIAIASSLVACSAAPAPTPSVEMPLPAGPSCDGDVCRIRVLDDAALVLLESKDHDKLRLELRDMTSAMMARLERIPWLGSLEVSGDLRDLAPLSRLTSLRALTILGLEAPSLEPLSQLTELRYLHIGLCEELRDTDLRALRDMKKLERLKVSCPSFVDVSPLGALPALREVDLVNTSVQTLSGLAGANLRRLFVQGGPSDVTAVAGMTELHELTLSELPLATDFTWLGKLTELVRLDIRGTGVAKLPPLTGPRLKHASFNGCKDLTDLSGLGEAPVLESLDLSHTGVADLEPLGHLPSLMIVYLSATKITTLAPLAAAPKLGTVVVSDDTPVAVKRSITDLQPHVRVDTDTEVMRAQQ